MEHSVFVIAISVSIAYLLFKFVEYKYILKENKPLKVLFRDTLIVYLSVVMGNFVLTQLNPITSSISNVKPEIYTNDPGF